MIESVIALLMFINGEIKEHLIQPSMAQCLRGNVKRRDSTQKLYLINAIRVRQKQRYIRAEKILKL